MSLTKEFGVLIHRYNIALITLLSATLISCSSGSDEMSQFVEELDSSNTQNQMVGGQNTSNIPSISEGSQFEGRWVLIGYMLDNGITKTVPDRVQEEGGGLGIIALSAESMQVQAGYCEYYEITYVIVNNVLKTSDPTSPEVSCAGMFGDVDNAERTALLWRTFLNSETLINLSDNSLIVTTIQNEQLDFERSML